MSFAAIANLVVFVLLAGVLFNFRKPRLTLGRQILLGLLLGAATASRCSSSTAAAMPP
jgi:L-cystine uptake protein TcyP (sodium:dicarboxylate symporter family)